MLKDRTASDKTLEKRTLARKITINDNGNVITGTIILDKRRKHFIGLCDDKKSRIFGEITRSVVNVTKEVPKVEYETRPDGVFVKSVEYETVERQETEEQIDVHIIKKGEKERRYDTSFTKNLNISLKPIANIRQRDIDEIKAANQHVRIEQISNHIVRVVCDDTTENEFFFYTRKLNKESYEVKLVHPEENKHEEINSTCLNNAVWFCLAYDKRRNKSNRLVDSTIYIISKENMIYTITSGITSGIDILVIDRITCHDKNHPFVFNSLWEECNISPCGERLHNNERYYHIDDLRFMLEKDMLYLSNYKHDLIGSSPFHIAASYDELKSISKLSKADKRDAGLVILRLQELEEEVKNIDGAETIFPFDIFDKYLGKVFDSPLVKEIRQINELCNKGLSYEEALDEVALGRRIAIKDGDKTIKGTILLDERDGSFMGLGKDDEDTLISGNITYEGKIIVSISYPEGKITYNGDLELKGKNAYVEGSESPASIRITPILGLEEAKRDKIRKAFDPEKLKERQQH